MFEQIVQCFLEKLQLKHTLYINLCELTKKGISLKQIINNSRMNAGMKVPSLNFLKIDFEDT